MSNPKSRNDKILHQSHKIAPARISSAPPDEGQPQLKAFTKPLSFNFEAAEFVPQNMNTPTNPSPATEIADKSGTSLDPKASEFQPISNSLPSNPLERPILEFIPSNPPIPTQPAEEPKPVNPSSAYIFNVNAIDFNPIFGTVLPAAVISEPVSEKELENEKLTDYIITNREVTEGELALDLNENDLQDDFKYVYTPDIILNAASEVDSNVELPHLLRFRDRPTFLDEPLLKRKNSRVVKDQEWRGKHGKFHRNTSQIQWRHITDEEVISTQQKFLEKAKEHKARREAPVEEQEAAKKKIKITLNKLTPNNFDKLKEQLLEIGKQSLSNLTLLTSGIFDKAWSEVKYTQMYANLCHYLKEESEGYVFPEPEGASDKNVIYTQHFKTELLGLCQTVFSSEPDEQEFMGMSEEQIEKKKFLNKKKTLGNVRFIGELFKVKLITPKTVLTCIQELLGLNSIKQISNTDFSNYQVNEDKLEGVQILLSTGGSYFDAAKVKVRTDKIILFIRQMVDKVPGIPSRIKFLLLVNFT
jgi:translation initiation factor 4G